MELRGKFGTLALWAVAAVTVFHEAPSVEYWTSAALCAEPSMGLWCHVNVTLPCETSSTSPLVGVRSVGAAGAQIVTMASDGSDHAETRLPRMLRAR